MRASNLFPLAAGLMLALAGCLSSPAETPIDPGRGNGLPSNLNSTHKVYASSAIGDDIDLGKLVGSQNVTELLASLHVVGQNGPEPSIGITSKGNIFFQALEKTMRSTDRGQTWQHVSGALTATATSDPYLWVDQVTDRVFQINMVGLVCSHIAWSDDEGETWLGNPMDCGPVPVNDHIKLATGPWSGAASSLGLNPVYPNAVYYAYNKLVGGYIAISLDGGATFPILRQTFPSGCNGALHGAITTAPDGSVYIPVRYCPGPLVAYSHDNGLTWENVVVGQDAGVPAQQKNPEIAVDSKNNVYMTWVGKDNALWMTISKDGAKTWSKSVPVSPNQVGSVTWPAMLAGDPGRVAFAYIATEDSRKGPWEVPDTTKWHLYYTYSLNALDDDARFVTIRITPEQDPVQRGTICIASSACSGGNRNLLDFIDMHMDKDGRPFIAFADGCTTPACLLPGGTPSDSRSRMGVTAIIQAAPSLWESVGVLKPIDAAGTHQH
jgi:hypothetical protein